MQLGDSQKQVKLSLKSSTQLNKRKKSQNLPLHCFIHIQFYLHIMGLVLDGVEILQKVLISLKRDLNFLCL